MVVKNRLLLSSLLVTAVAINAGDTGNWYEKLQWWKKAKPLYEYVKEKNDQVHNLTSELSNSEKKISELIQNFYKDSKIHKKETLIEINKLIDAHSDFSEEDLLDILKKLKASLEEFFNIDKQVKEAARILEQQKAMSDQYRETALENFEKIESVYDDKKARSFYEVIENSKENSDMIVDYLNNKLRIFLNTVLGKVKSLSSSINSNIESLLDQNIDVRYFTPEEKEEIEKKKKEEAEIAKQKKIAEDAEKAKQNMAWYKKLFNYIVSGFSYIITFIKKIFRLS